MGVQEAPTSSLRCGRSCTQCLVAYMTEGMQGEALIGIKVGARASSNPAAFQGNMTVPPKPTPIFGSPRGLTLTESSHTCRRVLSWHSMNELRRKYRFMCCGCVSRFCCRVPGVVCYSSRSLGRAHDKVHILSFVPFVGLLTGSSGASPVVQRWRCGIQPYVGSSNLETPLKRSCHSPHQRCNSSCKIHIQV